MPLTDIDGQRLGDSVGEKLGNRNLIINGAMQVAQRGTSSSTITTYATVDRFRLKNVNTDELAGTQQQSTTAPTGFSNSFKFDITTAESAIAADEYFSVRHAVEAQNLQHLEYNTSGAKAVTLSFWVRSHVTGTYSVGITNNDPNRNIAKTYSISSANTWEHKTVTFPGDTAGANPNNDNGVGFMFDWYLAAGSNYTSSDGSSWGAFAENRRAYGHTANAIGTTGGFYITGVQLEVGNTATPFEHRSYADELVRCQRYYQIITDHTDGAYGINGGYTFDNGAKTATGFNLGCPLRASPTIEGATTGLGVRTQGAGDTVSAVNHTGWAANSVWLAVGVTHSDLGNNDHAATLVNVAGNSVALNSEL